MESDVSFAVTDYLERNIPLRTTWVVPLMPPQQVPAITYGGPDVGPEEPSRLPIELAESGAIIEFLADP